MHTAEIVIFVIAGIFASLFIILVVFKLGNKRKQEKEYQEYVESIKIGDTFGHDLFKVYDVDDPFSENYGTLGFDSRYYATILDIKKNNKGETYVKYCLTQYLNMKPPTFTDEINNFLKHRTRISRRINNINTNE